MEYNNVGFDDAGFDGSVWAVSIKVQFWQTRETVIFEGHHHQSKVEEDYQVAVYADDAKMAFDMAYKFVRKELIEDDLERGKWIHQVKYIKVTKKEPFLLLPSTNKL